MCYCNSTLKTVIVNLFVLFVVKRLLVPDFRAYNIERNMV